MTRTKIPASRAALYVQIGHTRDDTPRMMPLNWQGHAGRAEKLLQFPHGTIVESMPWGADKGLPNYGSFGEIMTASCIDANDAMDYSANVRKILSAGKRYVLYIGRPQTELDFYYGGWFLRSVIHPRVEIAFDASAPEREGSYTDRLMREFPERKFWGEAHPKYEHGSCMIGRPLCYYAEIRKRVDLSNKMTRAYIGDDKYTSDGDHPEIMVAMTGHGRTSFADDIRDATRWARQGLTIGFEPHDWDKFEDAFEIVEGE
jgi:hypothetical protein